jgi:tyrosine-protein kinase Etk/Wzc
MGSSATSLDLSRQVPVSTPATELGDENIQIGRHLESLYAGRWLILATTLLAALIGAAYAFLSVPTYVSNILIQVEEPPVPTENVFGNQPRPAEVKASTSAEMEVLRSRRVVTNAVDETRYYISARPDYFPIVGNFIARMSNRLSEPGLFGSGHHVWGSESIELSQFDLPAALEGKRFDLVLEGPDTFWLTREKDGLEFHGRVGTLNEFRLPQGGSIVLNVSRVLGKPGARFVLRRASRQKTVQDLQNALSITEKGKQSGIINVSLEGEDPVGTTRVLQQIGREYIRQNEDKKAEYAEKSLVFLSRQLPELKQALEQSEARYNEVRNRHGTVNLSDEAKSLLDLSTLAQKSVMELSQEREKLLARFEVQHPSVKSVVQQILIAKHKLAEIDARIKRLPLIEQDVLRSSRDVKVNTDVYTAVLSTAQQMRLLSSSKAGTVRLLDSPEVPQEEAKPRRTMIIVSAALAGLVIGILAAFLRKALFRQVESAHDLERALGVKPTGCIPQAPEPKRLSRGNVPGRTAAPALPPLASLESFRRFHGVLQLLMVESRSNLVIFTGPTMGVGKSFVVANLALTMAAFGRKVLLVDADLRTGALSRRMDSAAAPGLSEALQGNADAVIRKNIYQDVDLIPAGRLPAHPPEILANGKFEALMRAVSGNYDLVLVDTPPVLAVADALFITPFCGMVFNVVRAGDSTLAEVEDTHRELMQAGCLGVGLVLNGVKPPTARYGYRSCIALAAPRDAAPAGASPSAQ